jgi:hypothetical protein
MTREAIDPDALARTLELLYAHIPNHYKRADHAARAAVPPQPAELAALVKVLAAPLAAVRQSVEELYADFFPDSADDAMLPVLAASIALELVFSDQEANRRDLRSAMARRRAKGTPAMLEAMARTLLDRQVATAEGWKAVMLAQDLNLIRPERVIPDLRPAAIAERDRGPLARVHRTLDPRPIGLQTGHVHPRHVVHWTFPTRLHPLRGAGCHQLPDGAADLRFAVDGANARSALRVRATGSDDRPGTDRVPDGLFAEDPGAWHGVEGRFTIRLTGLPAAAAPAPATGRASLRRRADAALAQMPVAVELLSTAGVQTSGPVELTVVAAPLAGGMPDMGSALELVTVTLDRTGLGPPSPGAGPLPAAPTLMLRLRPATPAVSRMVGETVLALTGGSRAALRAATDARLAEQGYLRGALLVRLPALRVTGPRWFHIAADGSLHEAALPGSAIPDRPLEGDQLPVRALVAAPVGPVWPPASETAARTPFAPALAAPGAAPVPLHGLTALRETGTAELPAGERCALVFALTFSAGLRSFEPMLRLRWSGSDPRTAEWEALDPNGAPLPAIDTAARFATLAGRLAEGHPDLALAVRFECERAGAILTPGEVAFSGCDGRVVLICLPECVADDVAPGPWPRGPGPLAAVSVPLEVATDGSTWRVGTNRLSRRSCGPAVPLLDPAVARRRVPAWRRLCPWDYESGGAVLDPTLPGRLDIDPRFGLFALAAADDLVPYPAGPLAVPPSLVTVDSQVGGTMDAGALPLDHGRVLNRPPRIPTRLVSASGHLGRHDPASLAALPLHRSLAEALAAIPPGTGAAEVVRIVDSAVYPSQSLLWPEGLMALTVEAAAGERPLVEIAPAPLGQPPPPAQGYGELNLTGLALRPVNGAATLALPAAQRVVLEFLSVYDPAMELTISLREAAGAERLSVSRCLLGPLAVAEPGQVMLADSALDAGGAAALALNAPRADVTMDRVTVRGSVEAGSVEVSDAILTGPLRAAELFRGCVRFSLIAPDSQTPRRHRVLSVDPAADRAISVPFLSLDPRDPAYLRLDPAGDERVLGGASNGGEPGVFNSVKLGEILRGVQQRLAEHTPAGLRTGLMLRH